MCALNADFFSFQVFFPKNERDFEATLDLVLAEYASFADLDDQDAVAERKVCFISVVFFIFDMYFRTNLSVGWSPTYLCANKTIYRKDETETVSHSLITKFETKKKKVTNLRQWPGPLLQNV